MPVDEDRLEFLSLSFTSTPSDAPKSYPHNLHVNMHLDQEADDASADVVEQARESVSQAGAGFPLLAIPSSAILVTPNEVRVFERENGEIGVYVHQSLLPPVLNRAAGDDLVPANVREEMLEPLRRRIERSDCSPSGALVHVAGDREELGVMASEAMAEAIDDGLLSTKQTTVAVVPTAHLAALVTASLADIVSWVAPLAPHVREDAELSADVTHFVPACGRLRAMGSVLALGRHINIPSFSGGQFPAFNAESARGMHSMGIMTSDESVVKKWRGEMPASSFCAARCSLAACGHDGPASPHIGVLHSDMAVHLRSMATERSRTLTEDDRAVLHELSDYMEA